MLLRLSKLRKRREAYVQKILHAKLSTNIGFGGRSNALLTAKTARTLLEYKIALGLTGTSQ